ncbi:MAG: glycosyltransferase [Vicinamibacteria bacterium]|nr:glycosyltransferase [Vicinamibacteria bacterium]
MATPLVSIITPVRNGARFIAESIRSLRAQSYPRIEHIVVDGGSTDGTLDILRQSSDVTFISEPDRGMYDAINKGLRRAQGEIVAYQNADDRYLPGAIAMAVAVMTEREDVDVLYGDFHLIDEPGERIATRRGRPFSLSLLHRYNYIAPHSAFVRRRVVVEDGHWLDAHLRFTGDWDWFLGMARRGRRFLYVPEAFSEFCRHRASLTSTLPWREKLAEWRRVAARHHASLVLLLWYETIYIPILRRMGWLR